MIFANIVQFDDFIILNTITQRWATYGPRTILDFSRNGWILCIPWLELWVRPVTNITTFLQTTVVKWLPTTTKTIWYDIWFQKYLLKVYSLAPKSFDFSRSHWRKKKSDGCNHITLHLESLMKQKHFDLKSIYVSGFKK